MSLKFDRIDFELLDLLQKNADLSNKQLANKVGLAQSSCLERVRRLRNEGVIQGVHADVDPKSVGIGLQAMLFLRLSKQARDFAEGFPSYALEQPEVVAVYFLSGSRDIQIHVAVEDADHLKKLLLGQFLGREEVEHIETSLILDWARSHVLPNYRDVK